MKEKLLIGRKDFADFPELGLESIAIKIDTGAYTSSIHCHHIKQVEIDGVKTIQFQLLDPSHENYNERIFTTKNFVQKQIKSSTGHAETRFIVQTFVLLFGNEYPIELSLSERGEMKFPVLIGRKLLSGKFIVDPAKYNLSHRALKNH